MGVMIFLLILGLVTLVYSTFFEEEVMEKFFAFVIGLGLITVILIELTKECTKSDYINYGAKQMMRNKCEIQYVTDSEHNVIDTLIYVK